MAKPQPLWIYDANGLPKADANPVFLRFVTKAGVARTQPADGITHQADDSYLFLPSDADEAIGVIALIDCGAPAFAGDPNAPYPRYQYVAICTDANAFALFVPFDAGSGALAAGAPTVGSFIELDNGAARTPPAVVKAGALELYTATPTSADILVGSAIRLDAPAGILPPSINVSFFPSAGPGPVVTLVTPAAAGAIGGDQLITVDITAVLGLRYAEITAVIPGVQSDEVIYRYGEGFAFKYQEPPNVVTPISHGVRVAFRRQGNWPADMVVVVDAIDTIGQEA